MFISLHARTYLEEAGNAAEKAEFRVTMAHPSGKARHDRNQQGTRRESKPGLHQRDRVLIAEQGTRNPIRHRFNPWRFRVGQRKHGPVAATFPKPRSSSLPIYAWTPLNLAGESS